MHSYSRRWPRQRLSRLVKKMSPDRKFTSCLRTLETSFDFIHQNIFKNDDRQSVGFIVISLLFVVFLSMMGYTIANYDRDIAIMVASLFVGTFQVLICIAFHFAYYTIIQLIHIYFMHSYTDFPQIYLCQ